MGLSMLDIKVGTVIDHTFDVDENEKLHNRDVVRRGIITRIEVDPDGDSIKEVYAKFRVDQEEEKIVVREMVRVYDADDSRAREAYRRVIGRPKNVGAEYVQKAPAVRRKIVDPMALTAARSDGLVKPEYNEDRAAGMDLPDGAGPQVVLDPNLHIERTE